MKVPQVISQVLLVLYVVKIRVEEDLVLIRHKVLADLQKMKQVEINLQKWLELLTTR